MKRLILTAVLLCTAAQVVQAQKSEASVTDEQWAKLITAISDEQWDTSFALASEYLKKLSKDDERLPKLRYIYLYAAAGEILTHKLSKGQFAKELKAFIGERIVMPYREIALECGGSFNYICPSEATEGLLVTTASDKTGTHILAFEYVKLQDKFDLARHEGEQASVGGIIQSIQLSPNTAVLWAMRIIVEKGFINVREQTKPSARSFRTTKNAG